MSKAANLAPTSELPFAARHCDVPYLDLIKNHRSLKVTSLESKAADDDAPLVQFAWSVAGVGDRMSQIGDVMDAATALFERAYRGDSTDLPPSTCFDKAMRLLGLSRELLQDAGHDADDALERVCDAVVNEPDRPLKSKGGSPAT